MGGVVAMDLAGDESHFPNAAYVGCLRAAKLELGLNTTVHAGEFGDTSPEEVRSAVLEMGADRIGHGYAAASDDGILALLRSRRVHLEICPASARSHGQSSFDAIRRFRELGLSVGLNTDDPASPFENTTLAEVERLARQELGFAPEDVRRAEVVV